jgi:transposase InsO family protein
LDNVDGFEIARMARLLEVSRSGYYDWARRQAAGPSPAQQRRADLTSKIINHHAESDRVYGSPRILPDLREAGEQVSAKTVARLMRHAGIVGISPRGFVPVTTQAGPDPHPVPDLVGRRFDQGALNRVWTSDITYLATSEP